MPLLGRHKSLPGSSANQSSARSGPATTAPAATTKSTSPTSTTTGGGGQQPLVCESPLFGVRCQLPVATQAPLASEPSHASKSGSGSTSSSASSMSSSVSLSSRLGGGSRARQPVQAQQSRDGQLGSTLSSIPKQISRQQIRYAFAMMDTNSDGLIDLRDLSQMLANLGVPIDEAILSHVMAPVSKRGDHLISESEFLDWIGNFIQVSDEPRSGPASTGAGKRAQVSRSASAAGQASPATSLPASLAAQSPEAQFAISQQLRQRRGSGSGLALVRSLSSSSTATAAAAAASDAGSGAKADQKDSAAGSTRERLLQDQIEARRDLKAAFCVFDLDGDGFITVDEVQKGLKFLGESWSQAELNQLFSMCASGRAKTKQRSDLSKQQISIDDFVRLFS